MRNEIFETMHVPKAYLKLAMPVVFSSVLTLVYNMVDTYFIAKTGITELVAGVSLCSPIFTLLIALGDILGLGGASVISRLFGQGKDADGKRISAFSFYGSIVIGIVMAAILLLLRTPVLTLLGATNETMQYASAYYFWIAAGAPFVIFALTPTNLLRTEGLATQAMIGSIIGSIVNIILDPVFIFGLNMGAGGAAIATVIGNICSDLFYLYIITRVSQKLTMNLKGFHISKEEVKAVLVIGIPSSITNFMASIGTTLLNRNLSPYGSEYLAAMGIVAKVTMIVTMIMVGLAFGGQAMFGYQIGSGNHKRLKDSLKFAYELVCGTALVLSAVLFMIAPQVLTMFMNDPAVLSTGTTMLRVMLTTEIFIGFTMVSTCFFQSAGNAGSALALSAGRQGYIYLVVLFILPKLFGYMGVISSQPVSDVLTAILAAVLMKKALNHIFAGNTVSH